MPQEHCQVGSTAGSNIEGSADYRLTNGNLMQRLVLVVLPSPPRSSRLDDQGLALILLCASRAWCRFHDGPGISGAWDAVQRQMLRRCSKSEVLEFTNITAHYSVLSAM